MFNKKDYFNLRNCAWQFLIDNNVNSLPVDLEKIAKNNNWILKAVDERLIPNHQACVIEHSIFRKTIILFSNSLPLPQARFRIAHEMAHIVLKHYEFHKEELEKEAQMFSARLLMPLCVLLEIGVTSPKEIQELCVVGDEPAKYRFKRLEEKIKLGSFYTNPLEAKVLQNFKNFINKQRKRNGK